MALDRISLAHFRNHRASELVQTAQFNLLVGENGAGKTNILEALSLLAPGRGLRNASLADLCGPDGGGSFAVGASLKEQGQESARLGSWLDPAAPHRRQTRINGAQANAAELGEWFALGWLVPAMDGLFADSAGARRRRMDRMALALDPEHARQVSRYESALRERGRLLESRAETAWLDAVEVQAAEHGARLAQGRAQLVERLNLALLALPDQPFARPGLAYRPGGPTGSAALAEELHRQRGRDRAAGRALTGPQRDELEVTMASNGRRAAQCSTGEQKAMLIAMTLAHADLASQGRPALLLLDEVAAHLDPLRREALFDLLRRGRAQVWMTGTEAAPFAAIMREAAVWQVRAGTVKRL